jgi:hypothetical protein
VPLVPLVRNSTLYTHPFPPQACAGNIHWLDSELTMPSSTVQVRIQDCLVPHIERPCIRYCHICFSYKAITPAPRWAQIPEELRHHLVFVVHDYGTTRLLRVRYFEQNNIDAFETTTRQSEKLLPGGAVNTTIVVHFQWSNGKDIYTDLAPQEFPDRRIRQSWGLMSSIGFGMRSSPRPGVISYISHRTRNWPYICRSVHRVCFEKGMT